MKKEEPFNVDVLIPFVSWNEVDHIRVKMRLSDYKKYNKRVQIEPKKRKKK
jgi:hypothetical protein